MTWERVKLSEVALINPRAPQLSDDESVSFVPMAAISEHTQRVEVEEIRTYAEVRKGYTGFSRGDVLLAKITPCFENGKMAIADIGNKHGFGSTEFHVMRTDSSRLDTRYLYHYLRQEKILVEGEKKMTGSGGQRRVPRIFLESLEIPLPPLPIQQRIAAVLDEVDALRKKRDQSIKKLGLIKSVAFKIANEDVCSKEILLGEMCHITKGTTPTTLGYSFSGSGIKFLRVQNLINGRVIHASDDLFLDQEVHLALSRSIISPGDILLSIAGTIGRSAVVAEADGEMNCNQAVAIIRPSHHINSLYMRDWLDTPEAQAQMRQSSVTATIANLSLSSISKMRLSLPDLDTQIQIVSKTQAVQDQIESQKISLDHLKHLIDAFQSRAFMGEIALRDLEALL